MLAKKEGMGQKVIDKKGQQLLSLVRRGLG
jgi:hypothetical protein